jgi:amino acid transporter/nucleotide-binding universal stress UspA family protein
MKGLERDLGLPAVLAISIGAMIGSGIFILPSLALEIAGPAVIAAYLLAGLLVLPAALAKSEMATAMPEAGGTYIYIERGMGPLLGTVAGVGTWFSLSFKSALALVGGVPYLVLLLDLPIKPVAIGLAVVLIGVNLLGAKQTGRLQVAIVVIMLGTLGYFSAGSATAVQQDFYRPFFVGGLEGLFAATGLVFVSYAGVTKVASVAEEVENPGRNIPLGILGSLAFTTLLYVAIVAVLVGVTVPGSVAGSLTPVAVAAEVTLGSLGVLAVVVAAVLALVSTANAGLLSSSRYPFAMSRDALAPPSLAEVSERFETPVNAITLTGAVMLALIAFVPILEIAKLASAFQILVFAIVNAAVISFREGSASYEPEFHTPLYPWMPVFGVLSGFALLSQMGLVALAGAGLITLGSLLWYLGYVRPRVSREGVATDALRRQVGRDAVAATVGDDDDSAVREVLVALTRPVTDDRERDLVALAADLVRGDDGRVVVMQFEEIPDQSPLVDPQQTPAERLFEERMTELSRSLEVPIEAGEIVSHDTKHAVVNYARRRGVGAVLAEHEHLRLRSRLLGRPFDWIVRHAPCDVLLVDLGEYGAPTRVAVVADGGIFPPVAVRIAEAIASANNGSVVLWGSADADGGPDARRRSIGDYRAALADALSVPVELTGFRTDGGQVRPPDLLVQRGADYRLRTAIFDDSPTRPIEGTSVTVYPHESRRPSLLRRAIERVLF